MVDEPPADARRPWLDPSEQAAWRSLMQVASQLGWALEHQLQRSAGLSVTEYYALALLSHEPDRTMRMSGLAKLTRSSLSRLSHLITRLESRGLVRRQADPTDGRFTFAILTDAGAALLETAAPGHVAAVRELVVDVVGPEQLRAVAQAADRVSAQVQEYRSRTAG